MTEDGVMSLAKIGNVPRLKTAALTHITLGRPCTCVREGKTHSQTHYAAATSYNEERVRAERDRESDYFLPRQTLAGPVGESPLSGPARITSIRRGTIYTGGGIHVQVGVTHCRHEACIDPRQDAVISRPVRGRRTQTMSARGKNRAVVKRRMYK